MMVRITLGWADVLRKRFKEFSFESVDERRVVKSFLNPVFVFAKEEEVKLNKCMIVALKKAKEEAKQETKQLVKELNKIRKVIDL